MNAYISLLVFPHMKDIFSFQAIKDTRERMSIYSAGGVRQTATLVKQRFDFEKWWGDILSCRVKSIFQSVVEQSLLCEEEEEKKKKLSQKIDASFVCLLIGFIVFCTFLSPLHQILNKLPNNKCN